MAYKFGTSFPFGIAALTTGPRTGYRAPKQYLPGVDGARVYRLGRDTRTWTIRGRLITNGLDTMLTTIRAYESFIDGKLYVFEDANGGKWQNCLMTDYRPLGPVEYCTLPGGGDGCTVEITATIEQLTP